MSAMLQSTTFEGSLKILTDHGPVEVEMSYLILMNPEADEEIMDLAGRAIGVFLSKEYLSDKIDLYDDRN